MSDSLPTVPETETPYPLTLNVKAKTSFVEELKDHPEDAEFTAGILEDARGRKGQRDMDLTVKPTGKVRLSGTIDPKKVANRIRGLFVA